MAVMKTSGNEPFRTDDYKAFVLDIKTKIQKAQIKAADSINQELFLIYWDLGKSIVEKQKETAWGDGFVKQLSLDLQEEFPNMKGFSERNLNIFVSGINFTTLVI